MLKQVAIASQVSIKHGSKAYFHGLVVILALDFSLS